ncbi:sigma-54 dependent transcriptional regulator [Patescibacteria group bacterium]|nr:sigma-54 dependent transcriptional regulator [Patescibacteria group bacterium]
MNEQMVVLNAANEGLKTEIENSAKVVEALTQSVEASSVVVNENGMIFTSSIMRQIVQEAKTITPHDIAVLITGESGVGKEELARFIHKESGRRGDFVPVNCGGLPETIAESVLFGHTKGAFTGAIENQIGYFQMAEGGTLFFDEIGDMSLNIQGKILRATDGHREFYPIGSKKKVAIDFRLISASNQPLEKSIQEKKFRDDLFYRLNGICLNIPPLRERPDDIIVLANHFLKENCQKLNKERLLFSEKTLKAFLNYNWPGNIRELKNAIERSVALAKGRILEVENFRFSNNLPNEEISSLDLKENEERLIIKALRRTGWIQERAKKLLGISRRQLGFKIDKLKIELPEEYRRRHRTSSVQTEKIKSTKPPTKDTEDKKEAEINKKARKKRKNVYQQIKPANKKPESRRAPKQQKPEPKEKLDKETFNRVLAACNWNEKIAAQLLGTSKSTLKQKIKRWHIGPAEKTKKA